MDASFIVEGEARGRIENVCRLYLWGGGGGREREWLILCYTPASTPKTY